MHRPIKDKKKAIYLQRTEEKVAWPSRRDCRASSVSFVCGARDRVGDWSRNALNRVVLCIPVGWEGMATGSCWVVCRPFVWTAPEARRRWRPVRPICLWEANVPVLHTLSGAFFFRPQKPRRSSSRSESCLVSEFQQNPKRPRPVVCVRGKAEKEHPGRGFQRSRCTRKGSACAWVQPSMRAGHPKPLISELKKIDSTCSG